MAKQIIIVTSQRQASNIAYTIAFWYPITQSLSPQSSGSQWSKASTQENSAIQNGSVLEEIESFTFPLNIQLGTIKDTLSSRWVLRNGQIAGVGPGQWLDINYDNGWSA